MIDEEHDPSYKHEGDPRYDARRVAAWRAGEDDLDVGRVAGRGIEAEPPDTRQRLGEAGFDPPRVAERSGRGKPRRRLLVGSATPRPETWHRLARLTLSERVGSRPLPPVQVLDMRGARHPLHPDTRRALSEARKAILLLNRRGWSNFLTCRTCAKVWECPQCDVALVLHRAEHAVACHHCGHRERVPQRCDACGSASVARYGAGTERLEAELGEALDVPVFRLDADTAGAKDAVPALLGRFAAAPAGLLIGTQMVAKGHDFPDVTLGVVVDADATLRFPDFRAEERTFALIAQLAGRAGRGPRGGRVLVQTTAPDAPAIVAAAQHDTRGFVAGELERRRALDYPPFADLIRIVCTAPAISAPRAAAGEIAEAVSGAAGATVLGPAPLFRLRGRHRSQVVVKAHDRAAAIAAVRDGRRQRGEPARAPRRGVLRRRRSAVASATVGAQRAERRGASGAGRGRLDVRRPHRAARRDRAPNVDPVARSTFAPPAPPLVRSGASAERIRPASSMPPFAGPGARTQRESSLVATRTRR